MSIALAHLAPVHLVLGHWHPPVQELWPEEQLEGDAELTAHCAVQDEVNGRVDER